MANDSSVLLLRYLRGLADAPAAEASDGELVRLFAERRDEAAFAALVGRHGAMVLGVCRRVLRNEQDAEDVFQAVFLVLSRKAGTLHRKDAVGPWLFGVARRLAWRARQQGRKRSERVEAGLAERVTLGPLEALTVREAQAVLDEELARLAERDRGPLVLCYLEGLTRDEAAQRLGCPLGTLKGRLERAREVLQRRLARRGLGLPATLSTLLLGRTPATATPAALEAATVKAAVDFAGGAAVGSCSRAVVLANAVLKPTLLSPFRIAAILILTAACGIGAGLATMPSGPRDEPGPNPAFARGGDRTDRADPPPMPRAANSDWPQWRGRDRDGVVRGVPAPETWPRRLTEEWKVAIGPGDASPVVVDGKVYVFTRKKDDEFVVCLAVADGKEVWRSEPYAAPYKVGPGEGNGDDRPRSTPAVADGRVFTLGMSGVLSCLDAATGQLLWHKDTGSRPYMGSLPMVADGLCVAHVGDDAKTGGLTAFDAATGEVKWRFSDGASATSGSPILVDLAGERQLVTYSNWNPVGVSLATGRKLWQFAPTAGGMPCTTPVRYKDLLILNDDRQPLRAVRLEKGDKGLTAREVWKAHKDLPLYYSSPVVVGDRVFGMSTQNGGCFFCLDAATGKILWQSEGRQGGYASLVSVGSVLLVLKDRGQLLVVRTSADAFETAAEYQLSDRTTLAHPVFLGDRILIKDDLSLRSFRIEPDAARP